MPERDHILIDLVKELLGPRHGPYEILPEDQDPRDEYITGVLVPAEASRSFDDIDADVDVLAEETYGEEDQDGQGVIVVSSTFSPALDPKALPRSIGLSFTVESNTVPCIEICLTWGRYYPHEQGFQRHPFYFLTGVVSVEQDNVTWDTGLDVSLQMRSRLVTDGCWRVSLFLVNSTRVRGEGRPDVDEYVFQPQIRVSCCPATCLVPVRITPSAGLQHVSAKSISLEDASLALLYRDRTALARGHLCGATWKEIDPERPHPSLPSPEIAPFAWTDATAVPDSEFGKFSPADVRTEMVPSYPVEAPFMEWNNEFGRSPEFNPANLAELWQPEEIIDALQPLVDGYRAWIQDQQKRLVDFDESQQTTANNHLDQCWFASERIREAINVLIDDKDVRLAFCFANRAIALQSQWSRNRVLTWRPFQLAFILLNIPALADRLHSDRGICDLLWFPTGGGKTEAYLGLTAFVLALRRRRARFETETSRNGGGTGVLSRYTLRLLTIQQFRRALGVVTACEYLRVFNLDNPDGPVGWRPHQYHSDETFLWGGIRFSAGLWVGGGVTPNNLLSIGPIPGARGRTLFAGALDILQGANSNKRYIGPNQTLRRNIGSSTFVEADGEPAQILTCPCCGAILAVPDEGIGSGQHTLHFVFSGGHPTTPSLAQFGSPASWANLDSATISPHATDGYRTLSLTFSIESGRKLTSAQIDEWWYDVIKTALGTNTSLKAARPARPGYFILTFDNVRNNTLQCDFDIYCPDPACDLNQHAWAEQVPLARTAQVAPASESNQMVLMRAGDKTASLPGSPGIDWQDVPEYFRYGRSTRISGRIPIPALTVDDQIYHRCPSLVIATVDKFARLAFEPKAAALFGNVSHYHSRWGYYRENCPPSSGGNLPSSCQTHPPGRSRREPLHVEVDPFLPPDLILQDELHLIEGPLGSMVGLYETSVDLLCQREQQLHMVIPKYIASTATVRQAESQVQALFDRQLAQFPPSAVSADDRFFAFDQESHPLDTTRPGRLYVAVCAPGKGAQTPIVRIWSSLLQSACERWQVNPSTEADQFYTLVGYFNALRELAGALSLYRQDIPERMTFRAGSDARQLEAALELSSRVSSLNLPALLERLTIFAPDAQDAVLATSMFGTGVDVDRLGLMVVHGQPKTTASYIQATGRVGRQSGGLVVTFFRASRPRDLDHYEFFTGYHRALYRYVEPVTVTPFSPRARERGLGPLSVILLRQARILNGRPVAPEWRIQQRLSGMYFAQAVKMANSRYDDEVTQIPDLLETRANQQPDGRRPPSGITALEAISELDRWKALASLYNPDTNRFVYYEPAMRSDSERHVVLGDAQHRAQGLSEAYENAPQSLRDVEETTGFKS